MESQVNRGGSKFVGWFGGCIFCIPYVALWMLTIYLNLKLLPSFHGNPGSTTFNLVLNFFQLIPPATFAFAFGWRLAIGPRPKRIFKKVAHLTLISALYEMAIVLAVLGIGAMLKQVPPGIPPILWLVIPIFTFLVLTFVFGLFHAISVILHTAMISKAPSSKPSGA